MTAQGTAADSLSFTVSGTEIDSLRAIRTIPGVAITAAGGANGVGTGWIASVAAAGDHLRWKAPGSSTYGPRVNVSGGGDFLLADGEDPAAWVRVSVSVAYMVPSPTAARVLLRDVYDNGLASDDVSAAEAAAGDVATTTVTITNTSTRGVTDVVAWIDSGASGLEISDDNATWVTPTTESGGLALADLAPGDTDTLYVRRTISAGAASDPEVLNHLHVSFKGL